MNTKIKTLLAAFLLISGSTAFSQPDIIWENSFGGTYTDKATDVVPLDDGTFLALAMPYSINGDVVGNHGASDYWLLRIDAAGEAIWKKTYGGSKDDVPSKIFPAGDGNFFILGNSESNDGDVASNHGTIDAWLLKIDPDGNILWQKSYGGTKQDALFSILPENDGGYVMVGYSYSNDQDLPPNNHGIYDLWMLKIDSVGEIVWSRLYGGAYGESAGGIAHTPDGGYIVSGSTESNNTGNVPANNGASDSWVFKLDSLGSIQWSKLRGGTDNDYTSNIVVNEDGSYTIFGMTASDNGSFFVNHGFFDFWVYNLSATGSFKWQKFYGGSGLEIYSGMIKLQSGNYLLYGEGQSSDSDLAGNTGANAWLLCIDPNGNKLWKKTYGGSQSEGFESIKELPDGSLIAVAYTGSNDGDVHSGVGTTNAGDLWVVRLGFNSGTDDPGAEMLDLTLLPNPAIDVIEIRSVEDPGPYQVSISSLQGVSLIRQPLHADQKVDVSTLPPGAYLLELQGKEKRGSGVFIKQ